MGLGAVHLRVARAIGVDAFLKAWQIYDQDPVCQAEGSGRPAGSGLEIRLRSFSSYLRYQRNRYIEELVAAGKTWGQIQDRVEEELGEKLSVRHISRIATGK